MALNFSCCSSYWSAPDHPDANVFLERQTQDALDQSHSKLIEAAERLNDVINEENNRQDHQMSADKGFVLTKEEIAKFIAQMIEEDEFDDLELITEVLATVAGGRYGLGPIVAFLGNFQDIGEQWVGGRSATKGGRAFLSLLVF